MIAEAEDEATESAESSPTPDAATEVLGRTIFILLMLGTALVLLSLVALFVFSTFGHSLGG